MAASVSTASSSRKPPGSKYPAMPHMSVAELAFLSRLAHPLCYRSVRSGRAPNPLAAWGLPCAPGADSARPRLRL